MRVKYHLPTKRAVNWATSSVFQVLPMAGLARSESSLLQCNHSFGMSVASRPKQFLSFFCPTRSLVAAFLQPSRVVIRSRNLQHRRIYVRTHSRVPVWLPAATASAGVRGKPSREQRRQMTRMLSGCVVYNEKDIPEGNNRAGRLASTCLLLLRNVSVPACAGYDVCSRGTSASATALGDT